MSKQLQYVRPHLLSRLHDELVAAGIRPERVEGIGDEITLTVPDSQSEAPVAAVVQAHNAAPAPPAAGYQLVDDLRQALANWDTLTAIQKDGVLRRCARAVVALADIIAVRSA